jgi:hypothetical protein
MGLSNQFNRFINFKENYCFIKVSALVSEQSDPESRHILFPFSIAGKVPISN